MKKLLSLTLSLILCLCLFGCGDNASSPSDGSHYFTDDLGRSVSVADTSRVSVLLGSFADMWVLAGGTLCACADDAFEDFQLSLSADTVNLGSTHRLDREGLIASDPTLVIGSAKLSGHLELREMLDSMGIPSAYFDVGDFDDYLRVLKIMTDLTGKTDNYEKYGTSQQQIIEDIIERSSQKPQQTVLVMRASAASIRAKRSEDTVLGCMLSDMGCINIADSSEALLDNLSPESILLENPDRLFFIETGDEGESVREAVFRMFSENPLWYELDCVKNDKVYFMEKKLYNLKPNASFAEAYEKLENILNEE